MRDLFPLRNPWLTSIERGTYSSAVTAAPPSLVYHRQESLDPLRYLSDFMAYPISLGLRMCQAVAVTRANLLMGTRL